MKLLNKLLNVFGVQLVPQKLVEYTTSFLHEIHGQYGGMKRETHVILDSHDKGSVESILDLLGERY